MPKQIIHPPGAAPALARYSPGVLANGMLYVSGLLAISPSGDLVGKDDVRAQTRHVLEALRDVVQAAGGELSDVVHNAIFLKSLDDYAAFTVLATDLVGAILDVQRRNFFQRHIGRADMLRVRCAIGRVVVHFRQ